MAARKQGTGEKLSLGHQAGATSTWSGIRKDFVTAISMRVRSRLVRGEVESGSDIIALRRFVLLTQEQFAKAMGISVQTLRNWEQDRRRPEGPALALPRTLTDLCDKRRGSGLASLPHMLAATVQAH